MNIYICINIYETRLFLIPKDHLKIRTNDNLLP